MPIELASVAELAEAYAARHPQEILAFAIQESSPHLAVSFSGAEDVVLIDMAVKLCKEGSLAQESFRVFSPDTGRLHAETYPFLDKGRGHYEIPTEGSFSPPRAVPKTGPGTGPISPLPN